MSESSEARELARLVANAYDLPADAERALAACILGAPWPTASAAADALAATGVLRSCPCCGGLQMDTPTIARRLRAVRAVAAVTEGGGA